MDTQFDRLVDRFEDEIKAGNSPKIEAFVDEWLQESGQCVIRELIWLEVFYLAKHGLPMRASDYARFGDEASDHARRAIEEYVRTIAEPQEPRR